jgi:hypothetical protein
VLGWQPEVVLEEGLRRLMGRMEPEPAPGAVPA